MDTFTIILAFSAFFIASFLKGLTGIGFSTLCLGFLAMFVDIKMAIPLVFIPSLFSNILVMVDAGHFSAVLKRFRLLFVSAIPGLFLGIWFLSANQNDIPKCILGFVMLLYGIWGLKFGLFTISGKSERILTIPVALFSGIVNGATGSQIMPIMPYLLSLNMERNQFVMTINLSFTINTLIMMASLGKLGLLSMPLIFLSSTGIIPVAAGIFLGGYIRKRVSEAFFRKMVLMLLILLGIILFLKPFV